MNSRLLHRPTVHRLALAALTVALLAPFLNKPVHVDDPLFIWSAQQIHRSWYDFYGYSINWYFNTIPAWSIIENPPLAAYYMAAAAAVVGWSEAALHAAFLVPAVAMTLGVYELARRHCGKPLLACLIMLGFPVVLVSGTTLMCDVMMLALWVWAVVLWDIGVRDGRAWAIVGGGVLIGAAALTKYFGVALIPLLLVYGLALRRRTGWWLPGLLIPVAILIGYQWLTHHLYGQGLMLQAISYAGHTRKIEGLKSLETLVVGVAFMGGCLATVLFYAPLLWSWRGLLAGVVACLLIRIVLEAFGQIGAFEMPRETGWQSLYRWEFAVAMTLGLAVLALAAGELRRWREPGALLLLLWVAGTFVFATAINWTTNGRSILPMAPALAIMAVRRIEARHAEAGPWNWRWLAPLPPALALTLLVAWADTATAQANRRDVYILDKLAKTRHLRLWFEGHWGFQYYMQKLNYRPLEAVGDDLPFHADWPDLRPGDVVVVPINGSNSYELPVQHFFQLARILVKMPRYVATMSTLDGAGFYTTIYGPLPFVFDPIERQAYLLEQYKGRPAASPPAIQLDAEPTGP